VLNEICNIVTLLQETTLKFYSPVFLKQHTGFWNCVLCELYAHLLYIYWLY